MKFFLDTRESESTGEAILSLGDQAGGDVVAKLPYKTPRDRIRANMFKMVPEMMTELEGARSLWWYFGDLVHKCPDCGRVDTVAGASDAQIGRLERIRALVMDGFT